MIRKLWDTLFVSIPKDEARNFRAAIASENLTRLLAASIALSLVEAGIILTLARLTSGISVYPYSVLLFNIPMIPLLIVLRKRKDLIRFKQALVYLCITFYLVWSCMFTWAMRAGNRLPEFTTPLSSYMLVVFGVAIFLYLKPVRSAVYFLASLGLFAAVMPYDTLTRASITANLWNALALNMFAWIISRLLFAFRLRTYLDNKLIQDKNTELELERNSLKEALANVKQLSGLLPICANCKKIRDDKGYWQQVEGYVTDRSDVIFSHGLCPECVKKLYPDLSGKIFE